MITVTEKLNLSDDSKLNKLKNPEDILFFDIETTGLSADYCTVYLIGCVFYSDGDWFLKQFFADSLHAEEEILLHFFMTLAGYKKLIHFNGDTFDIPFINKRAKNLNILQPSCEYESFDIYKKIKPLKKILNLNDCKQKTIEGFLGINREDIYTGGQLIEIYKDYLKTQDDEAKRLLLLHNSDDLKGMPDILPILDYADFFEGKFNISNINIEASDANSINISATIDDLMLPTIIHLLNDDFILTAKNNNFNISIKLFSGELKHFYSDYKNYYYLPNEDIAVYKSVGEFVDKSRRKKATAKTCYSKSSGTFIPAFNDMSVPLFYESFPLKNAYALYDNSIFDDNTKVKSYIKNVITTLFNK